MDSPPSNISELMIDLKNQLKEKMQNMSNTIICNSAGNSPNNLLVVPSDINEPNFISVGLASSPSYYVVEHDTSFEKPDLVMPQIINTGAWIGNDSVNFTSKTCPLVWSYIFNTYRGLRILGPASSWPKRHEKRKVVGPAKIVSAITRLGKVRLT